MGKDDEDGSSKVISLLFMAVAVGQSSPMRNSDVTNFFWLATEKKIFDRPEVASC